MISTKAKYPMNVPCHGKRFITFLPGYKGQTKAKLLGRVLPEPYKDTRSWRRVLEYRKPDMHIPTLKASLTLSEAPAPAVDSDVKNATGRGAAVLSPTLPKSKIGQKVALAAYNASLAVSDILLKLSPQFLRPKEPVLKKDPLLDSKSNFLVNMHDLRTWADLTDSSEIKLTKLHNLKPGEEIAILGGGISGLTLAWFLANARPDIKIKIIEKEKTFGGYMCSELIEDPKTKSKTVFEYGPRTLLPSNAGVVIAVQIMRQIGMLEQLVGIHKQDPVNQKGLYFKGELVKLPGSLAEALKFLANHPLFKGVLGGTIKDFFKSGGRPSGIEDESVESFLSRRMNKHIPENLVSAILRGIYAGDVGELSAKSVTRFKHLYSAECVSQSSIVSSALSGEASLPDKRDTAFLPVFSQPMLNIDYPLTTEMLSHYSMLAVKGGMQSFASNLAKALRDKFPKQVVLLTDTHVKELRPAANAVDIVTNKGPIKASIAVSTLPSRSVASTLTTGTKAKRASELMSKVKFTNLAVVDIFFPNREVGKNWFGYLVPKSENLDNPEGVLGVVFDSAIRKSGVALEEYLTRDHMLDQEPSEPESVTHAESVNDSEKNNKNQTTLTVMMGGPLWKEGLTESQWIDLAVSALKRQLKLDIKPEDYIAKVRLQTNSIPLYTVGHAKRVESVNDIIGHAFDNRLMLSGTSFGRGVGIGDCVLDSLTIASRFSEQRKLLFADYYAGLWMTKLYPNSLA